MSGNNSATDSTPKVEHINSTASDHADSKENDYVQLLSKKIRSYNKKIQKIKETEEKLKNKGTINEEQQKILNNRDSTEKALKDFIELKTQMTKLQQQEEKHQKRLAKKKDAIADGSKETVQSKQIADHSRIITTLLHVSQAFGVHQQDGAQARANFLKSQEEVQPSGKVVTQSDLDAIIHLANLIEKRQPTFKEGVDKDAQVLQKLLSQSEEELQHGVTYKRAREALEEIYSSKFFSQVQEAPKQQTTEKGQEKSTSENELPSSINEVAPEEDSKTDGQTEYENEEGKDESENKDSDNQKRGGYRGRGRGRGQGGRGRGRYNGENRRGRGSFRPRGQGQGQGQGQSQSQQQNQQFAK